MGPRLRKKLEFRHDRRSPTPTTPEPPGENTMPRNPLSLAFLCLLAILAAAPAARAGSAHEIDVSVDETLDRFFYRIGGARELAHKAVGILVFPSVVKAGFGFGGEYGEGALRIHGRTVDYYNTRCGLVRLSARRAGALGHHHVHDAGGARSVPTHARAGRSGSTARSPSSRSASAARSTPTRSRAR